jgi:gas vesicle protein
MVEKLTSLMERFSNPQELDIGEIKSLISSLIEKAKENQKYVNSNLTDTGTVNDKRSSLEALTNLLSPEIVQKYSEELSKTNDENLDSFRDKITNFFSENKPKPTLTKITNFSDYTFKRS